MAQRSGVNREGLSASDPRACRAIFGDPNATALVNTTTSKKFARTSQAATLPRRIFSWCRRKFSPVAASVTSSKRDGDRHMGHGALCVSAFMRNNVDAQPAQN